MDLQNKIAVVTGASKGIGLETAKALLEAGAKVAGWSRSKGPLEHANYLHIETDMRDYASVENAFNQTKQHWNDSPAVLVNNAGLGYAGKMEEMPVEEWHRLFETNVNGVFYATRLVLPDMKKKEEGHIINIASIAGTTGVPNMVGYAASKHAVRGFSHSLYMEVREAGIKVTCVYPGSVQTNFFDELEVKGSPNMMRPQDVAETILHAIRTHWNFHLVDIEMRPLKPKG